MKLRAPHPIRFLAMLASFWFLASYIAICDWRDERKARKAGAEPETSND